MIGTERQSFINSHSITSTSFICKELLFIFYFFIAYHLSMIIYPYIIET
jgi:hypothetical protein